MKEDLDALLKFPNLTSVDFTPFVLWGMAPPEGRKYSEIGELWKKTVLKSRLVSLCDRLKRIPKLRQLRLETDIEWVGFNQKDYRETDFIVQSFGPLVGVRKLLFGSNKYRKTIKIFLFP